MKKIFAVLLILGTAFFFAPDHVNASWWYDITHSDRDYEWDECWECNGSGKCSACNGSGICPECRGKDENCYACSGYGECSECNGYGRCNSCYGTGGEWRER